MTLALRMNGMGLGTDTAGRLRGCRKAALTVSFRDLMWPLASLPGRRTHTVERAARTGAGSDLLPPPPRLELVEDAVAALRVDCFAKGGAFAGHPRLLGPSQGAAGDRRLVGVERCMVDVFHG